MHIHNKSIVRGPYKGGMLVPVQAGKPYYRVIKADGHRAVDRGRKLERIHWDEVKWMTNDPA